MITTILFDIGDTLVRAAAPGTPVEALSVDPVAGAVRTLAALAAHFRLGAVTDTAVMTAAEVKAALSGSGLDDLLEVIVTSVDVGASKPDPRGIEAALAALGALPEEALFVGDSDVDEAAARAAGVRFARSRDLRDPRFAVRAALMADSGAYRAARALVAPIDSVAGNEARLHHDRLTKPPGSLGRLEDLGIQLAEIGGGDPPEVPAPAAVAVFAGDHGVVAEGVTPWPQEVTGQMVANFVAGGAAINVLARQAGASVTVIDVGVASDLDALGLDETTGLLRRNVRAGTANLARGPAMTTDDARAARDIGAELADRLVDGGARLLVTGEMGIGNTTAAAAVIAALTDRPAASVTGRGTGVDDDGYRRKIAIVESSVGRLPAGADALSVLAEVGGLEIAALAGFIVGGASHRVPVIVDGVIALAGLLAAVADCPAVLPYVVAGHRSTEPGATAALNHVGLEPLLELGLRLGEGTGACLAIGLVEAAARILREMATFDAAGITDKPDIR
jgi:nicotinate-nucleotide--dimethylbenzimidazole phosphoribosyltransferase